MKKVSVIVPVYNVEKYIGKCLDSLVNQTLKDIEIIVVNDGSPDNSQDIIDEYVKRYPKKIKSFIKKNGGQGSARNYGIKESIGEYVGYVDSDDYVSLDMFEKLYNKAKETNADIIMCGRYDEDELTHKLTSVNVNLKDINKKKNAYYDTMSPCTKLFKRELIVSNNILFPSGIWYEDVVFCLSAISMTDKIDYLDENLYYYLTRNGSIMNNDNSLKNLDVAKALDLVKEYMIKNNVFDKNILSYLVFDYGLITTINRVLKHNNKEKNRVIKKLRKYCHDNVSDYKKQEFYKEIERNRKIIANLNYMGLERVSNMLLELKKILNR